MNKWITGGLITGGLVIAAGGATVAQYQQANRYDKVEQSYTKTMQALDQANKKHHKVTLVVHRHGCHACQTAEKTVMWNLYLNHAFGGDKSDVIMTDAQKFTPKQLATFKTKVASDMLTDTGGLPTPLVARIKPDKQGNWHPTSYSDTDDKSAIRSVIWHNQTKDGDA